MSGTTVDPEDAKIVTLARSTRARNRTPEGAAVRDENGRTYAASTVDLASLRLTALQTAIVGESGALAEADRAAVRDLGGTGTPVLLAAPDGSVTGVVEV